MFKVKESGSKVYVSVTPKYPRESVRILDHRGAKDPPHQNVNICQWWRLIEKIKKVVFYY